MRKVKKQFLSFVLALALAASLVGGTGLTAYAADTDTGTAVSEETALGTMEASTDWYDDTATEYKIETADDLAGLASLVSGGNDFSGKTISLTADIDMSGYTDFVGIGTSTYPFAGTFDGGGHTVTLALSTSTSSGALGLFAYVNGAVIQNVVIAGTVKTVSNNNGTGGLVGYVAGTGGVTVENCINQANITGASYVGGLVGRSIAAAAPVYISDSSNEGNVTGSNGYAGGIIFNICAGSISDCENSGTVSGSMHYLGGIVGGIGGPSAAGVLYGNVSVKRCVNTGSDTSSSSYYYYGGIAAYVLSTRT